MKKKLVSIFLALTMCVGLAAPAFATGNMDKIRAIEYKNVAEYIENAVGVDVQDVDGAEDVTYYSSRRSDLEE